MRNGHAELLYPYAKMVGTGILVLPSAQGIIGDMAGAEFYDAAKHKGHLVCPECEQAHLGWRRGKAVGGDDRRQRDHFAMLRGEQHSLHCQIGQLGLSYPLPGRRIDERKGGYVYANLQTVSPTEPPRIAFQRKTTLPDGHGSKTWPIPDWARRIELGPHITGFPEIVTPDFVDRKRYHAVSDISGLVKLITHIPPLQLKDTWIIRKRVAIRLDKMIIREGRMGNSREKNIEREKREARLPHDFLMAANKGYDRFARVLNDMSYGGMRYPVILHFTRAAVGKKEMGCSFFGEKMLTIDLPSYEIQNPSRVRGEEYHSLALPFVKVERKVIFKDAALFDVMGAGEIGKEFFAVAYPVISRAHGKNGHFIQAFEVLRKRDVVELSITELVANIREVDRSRAGQHQPV